MRISGSELEMVAAWCGHLPVLGSDSVDSIQKLKIHTRFFVLRNWISGSLLGIYGIMP